MKAKTAGEFFGTLQQSVVESWRMHLETNSYNTHVVLNDFYDKMIDLVDELNEHYLGINGTSKVKGYANLIEGSKKKPSSYLEELKDFITENMEEYCGKNPELKSDIDSIFGLIDSTVYKLSNLIKEGIDYGDTKMERLNPLPSFSEYAGSEDFDDQMKEMQEMVQEFVPTLTPDKVDSHYMDLYLKKCPEVDEFIKSIPPAFQKSHYLSQFVSQIDNEPWYELTLQNWFTDNPDQSRTDFTKICKGTGSEYVNDDEVSQNFEEDEELEESLIVNFNVIKNLVK